MRTISTTVILLLALLALQACNRPQEADTAGPDGTVAQQADPAAGSGDAEAASPETDEEEILSTDPEYLPPREYTEEQIATVQQLLAKDPATARRELVDEGAVLNSDYLIEYIRLGRVNMVARMVASGMDLNQPAENGKRPLAEAFLRNDPFIADMMINHGADPLLGDNPDQGVGRSFLHYASKIDNPEMVQRLLDLGIEPDVTDVYDQTPVDVAATYGEDKSLRVLLEAGADPMRMDTSGSVPILLAAGYGNLGSCRILLEYGADLNFQHERGWTPLLLSIYYNHTDVANWLLDNGANVTASLRTGYGAAGVAATMGNAELLRRVIDLGAPLDLVMVEDERNLIHACVMSDLNEFIRELAERGVDPAAEDKEGKTPLDLAREVGNTEAEEVLMELTGAPPLTEEERKALEEARNGDADVPAAEQPCIG